MSPSPLTHTVCVCVSSASLCQLACHGSRSVRTEFIWSVTVSLWEPTTTCWPPTQTYCKYIHTHTHCEYTHTHWIHRHAHTDTHIYAIHAFHRHAHSSIHTTVWGLWTHVRTSKQDCKVLTSQSCKIHSVNITNHCATFFWSAFKQSNLLLQPDLLDCISLSVQHCKQHSHTNRVTCIVYTQDCFSMNWPLLSYHCY